MRLKDGSMRHFRHTGTGYTERGRRARGVGACEGTGRGWGDAMSWEAEPSGATEQFGLGPGSL